MGDLTAWWGRRWMVVSLVALLLSTSYLIDRQLTETRRLNDKVNQVRFPVCSVMFSALSRVPAQSTPAQLQARPDLIKAYGPDGLKCPLPLPAAARIPTPPTPTK
jgi:hypothetical protein